MKKTKSTAVNIANNNRKRNAAEESKPPQFNEKPYSKRTDTAAFPCIARMEYGFSFYGYSAVKIMTVLGGTFNLHS